jgi:hypothetical protein
VDEGDFKLIYPEITPTQNQKGVLMSVYTLLITCTEKCQEKKNQKYQKIDGHFSKKKKKKQCLYTKSDLTKTSQITRDLANLFP